MCDTATLNVRRLYFENTQKLMRAQEALKANPGNAQCTIDYVLASGVLAGSLDAMGAAGYVFATQIVRKVD